MSHNNKISVIILGQGESLKTALITNITGKDLSTFSKTETPEKIVIYEDDTYRFTQTPDLKKNCEDMKKVFSKEQTPDMCLLVVEYGFSPDEVKNTIENLSKTTRRPPVDFAVVLPVKQRQKAYPFKSYNIEQLISELTRLPGKKSLEPTNNSSEDSSELELAQKNKEEVTGFKNRKENSPEDKRNLKRKHPVSKVNLILVGMAGTGKSASGNTILGKKIFKSRPSSVQVTKECQKEETQINDLHLRVIDTPDMFNDEMKPSVRDQHVKTCRELCDSCPCVFVLVMHVSRFTDGERDILTKLETMFGANVSKQTVLLFTRGNDLEQSGMTLNAFLNECQEDLKKIVKNCGYKCVLFENKSNSDQVAQLMQEVNSILAEHQEKKPTTFFKD